MNKTRLEIDKGKTLPTIHITFKISLNPFGWNQRQIWCLWKFTRVFSCYRSFLVFITLAFYFFHVYQSTRNSRGIVTCWIPSGNFWNSGGNYKNL